MKIIHELRVDGIVEIDGLLLFIGEQRQAAIITVRLDAVDLQVLFALGTIDMRKIQRKLDIFLKIAQPFFLSASSSGLLIMES